VHIAAGLFTLPFHKIRKVMSFNVDLELKHVLRYNVLVCITMHD